MIEDVTQTCRAVSSNPEELPAVIIKIKAYSIDISNYAARETILNILSVLQQLCLVNYPELPKSTLLQAGLI